MVGARTGDTLAADFWSQRLAVVSPHRAQSATIRNALPEALRGGAFIETVDRIQGKERDAIILSYCVADAEFALAEADFIFAPERLNVAVRSEEHTSELQSLLRIWYAVFWLKKKKQTQKDWLHT